MSDPSLVLFLVAALATWEVVEIWHHGSIFANWRARMELGDGFINRLLMCPFCLSVWVGVFIALVLWISPFWPVNIVLYGLAVARLANLGNDLTHRWCRTPRPEIQEPENGTSHPPVDEAGPEAV